VAFCQPASSNRSAKSNCVQSSSLRRLPTCRPIKFRFFIATKFLPLSLPEFISLGCNEFVTAFGNSKTDFPRHGKAMQWEVGVIKLTANRRQFSPMKPQLREKQAKLPDPLWDEG